MDTVRIGLEDPRCPPSIGARLGHDAPASLDALGNLDLLRRRKLAVLCSVKCPGGIILQSYDLMQRLRRSDLAVVGGFQSPMEREWLAVLLRGPGPVVLCPARGIEGMRLPSGYWPPLREGRLLILSCFPDGPDRPTVETALARNRFVAALANDVLVAHASPGGKTEGLCRELLEVGVPLYTLEDRANENLLRMGARPVRLGQGVPLPWGCQSAENVRGCPEGGKPLLVLDQIGFDG
jgi:predicted Rossmann fold nucleotide-binding protein DprA/Smf involved in DNA uptake